MFGIERKLNVSLQCIPAVGNALNSFVMFNKTLLQAYGATSEVVKTALKAHTAYEKTSKLNLQKFNASLEAAEALAELRYWFDVTKKEKRTHKDSGAPLPDWYTFASQVTGIGRSWGAYYLQAQGLIDSGAVVADYLAAEETGRADIKRFIRWAKDGVLERPEVADEAADEVADEAADEAADGAADEAAEDVIQVRAAGCVINVYADGRVESIGPNVSEVVDALFSAIAAVGLV